VVYVFVVCVFVYLRPRQPSPRRAIVPGVKFSMTTSACSTRSRKMSRPSGFARLIEMDRLPRLMLKK
jgi:rubredoxin